MNSLTLHAAISYYVRILLFPKSLSECLKIICHGSQMRTLLRDGAGGQRHTTVWGQLCILTPKRRCYTIAGSCVYAATWDFQVDVALPVQTHRRPKEADWYFLISISINGMDVYEYYGGSRMRAIFLTFWPESDATSPSLFPLLAKVVTIISKIPVPGDLGRNVPSYQRVQEEIPPTRTVLLRLAWSTSLPARVADLVRPIHKVHRMAA